MSDVLQRNKQLVERFYRDCINAGRLELIEELIGQDFVGTRGERGPAEYTQTIAMLLKGFPDVHFAVEDLVAEGDRVVARWTMEGTQRGPFVGFPASQKRVTQGGIVIYQIRDGKIVRAWLQNDRLGLLQQIGAVPELANTAPRN